VTPEKNIKQPPAAGRVSPEFALFPCVTVDKLHGAATHTGAKTIVRIVERVREQPVPPGRARGGHA